MKVFWKHSSFCFAFSAPLCEHEVCRISAPTSTGWGWGRAKHRSIGVGFWLRLQWDKAERERSRSYSRCGQSHVVPVFLLLRSGAVSSNRSQVMEVMEARCSAPCLCFRALLKQSRAARCLSRTSRTKTARCQMPPARNIRAKDILQPTRHLWYVVAATLRLAARSWTLISLTQKCESIIFPRKDTRGKLPSFPTPRQHLSPVLVLQQWRSYRSLAKFFLGWLWGNPGNSERNGSAVWYRTHMAR